MATVKQKIRDQSPGEVMLYFNGELTLFLKEKYFRLPNSTSYLKNIDQLDLEKVDHQKVAEMIQTNQLIWADQLLTSVTTRKTLFHKLFHEIT
jgi:hypothetical protein